MTSNRSLVAVTSFCAIILSASCGDPSESAIKSSIDNAAMKVFSLSGGNPLTFSCGFDETTYDSNEMPSGRGTLAISVVIQQLSEEYGCRRSLENYKKCGQIAKTVSQRLGLCADVPKVFDACSFVKLIGSSKYDQCKIEELVKKAILKLAKDRFFSKDPKPDKVETLCYSQGFVEFTGKNSDGKAVKQLTERDICKQSSGSKIGTSSDPKWTKHLNAIERIACARINRRLRPSRISRSC